MYEGLFELDICVDGGIVSKRSFDATEETIDAVGEALALKAECPDRVVTLLVTETARVDVETPNLVRLLCRDNRDWSKSTPPAAA